ncbi:MAG: YggS family pyridoxal phosphate-dependent enzyme [Anaerolineaceae bacterium]|nr:MAG: YggS family pyridoxal phosphate-dependent enzyme [Anaerolineaceae bacterium]
MIKTSIADNIAEVQANIASACDRAGRSPDDVTLVAVSKRQPLDRVIAAVQAGLVHLGENRIDEAEMRRERIMAAGGGYLVWHMLGRVEPRRVRYIPRLFQRFHALDSVRLAERLSDLIVAGDLPPFPVWVEVNITGEASKAGFDAHGWAHSATVFAELRTAIGRISHLRGLDLRGLMTLAPYVADMEQTRPVFAGLRHLRDALTDSLGVPLPDLSMGMTNDYPVAIEEGATTVRVGRAIFGERD